MRTPSTRPLTDETKRRFRFGLKSLFVVVTLLCVVLALIAEPILERRRLQNVLNRVTAMKGRISLPGQLPSDPSVGRYLLSFFSSGYSSNYLYGFDLSGTNVTDDDLEWIAQVKDLKELDLGGTQISDAGMHHLRHAPFLTKLDLEGTRVTDQARDDLLTLDILASLDVGRTGVTYKTLEELDSKLQYAHFCEQRAIDQLLGTGVQVVSSMRMEEGDPSRGCWTVYSGRTVLRAVAGMGRPALTARDVENLGHLDSLPVMTFHSAKLGPTGLIGLRRLANLKALEVLYTNLSDSDLAAIANQTQLVTLRIIGCDAITDDGVSQLRSLKKLKWLTIDCKRVSKTATEELAKELPNCKIEGR